MLHTSFILADPTFAVFYMRNLDLTIIINNRLINVDQYCISGHALVVLQTLCSERCISQLLQAIRIQRLVLPEHLHPCFDAVPRRATVILPLEGGVWRASSSTFDVRVEQLDEENIVRAHLTSVVELLRRIICHCPRLMGKASGMLTLPSTQRSVRSCPLVTARERIPSHLAKGTPQAHCRSSCLLQDLQFVFRIVQIGAILCQFEVLPCSVIAIIRVDDSRWRLRVLLLGRMRGSLDMADCFGILCSRLYVFIGTIPAGTASGVLTGV